MNGVEQIISEFVMMSVWQIGLIFLVAILVSRLLSRTNARFREGFWM